MSNLFINADLILTSAESLGQIIDEFGEEVLVLHRRRVDDGKTLVSFEVSLNTSDAESTLREFFRLAEGLSAIGRDVWSGCDSRVMDIGFESSAEPGSFSAALAPGTVQRLAALDIGVTVTIYPL